MLTQTAHNLTFARRGDNLPIQRSTAHILQPKFNPLFVITNGKLVSSIFSGLLVRRCHRTASATTTTSLMLSDLQAPVAERQSGYTPRAPTYRGTTLVKQVSTPEKPHYSQNPPLFYGLNEQNPQPVFIVTLAWFL